MATGKRHDSNPAQLHRILFFTEDEKTAAGDRLDQLLASCWSIQSEIEDLKPSREKSLALTKLEEFAMWAKLAILNSSVKD